MVDEPKAVCTVCPSAACGDGQPVLVSVCQSIATKLWIISPFMSLHTLYSLTFSWPKGQKSANPCLADTLQLHSSPLFSSFCVPSTKNLFLICLFASAQTDRDKSETYKFGAREEMNHLQPCGRLLLLIFSVLFWLQPLLFERPLLLFNFCKTAFRLVAGTRRARRASFI